MLCTLSRVFSEGIIMNRDQQIVGGVQWDVSSVGSAGSDLGGEILPMQGATSVPYGDNTRVPVRAVRTVERQAKISTAREAAGRLANAAVERQQRGDRIAERRSRDSLEQGHRHTNAQHGCWQGVTAQYREQLVH